MKTRLFTPGPTPVPEETLLELAKPVGYHRSSEAKAILAEVTEDLKYVFQTANPVVTLTSSGTGGMEAAVNSCLAAGEKAILLSAGRWGERWKGVLKAHGANIVLVEVSYGKAITPEMLAKALADNEKTIVGEFAAVQGKPADIGGYYWADVAKVEAIMRPSKTLNSVLASANA